MTEQQIRDLGPAFARYLDGFRDCFADHRALEHLRAYCRGLLSDLPRKSVEPIALASGTAVRTLQEFLKDYTWDHAAVRDRLQRRVAVGLGGDPDPIGTVGIVDETSAVKKGTKTPGVQRQYLGCVGKVGNGIVTVHLGVARGHFKALLDAELFLPESWDADRDRCTEAEVPDDVVYRPKWHLALDQVRRAVANGVHLDWVGFDEEYGDKPGFLAGLEESGLTYAGEVPRDFPTANGPAFRVVASDPRFTGQRWRALRVPHQSEPGEVWEVKAARVHLRRDKRPTAGEYWLIAARSRRTEELKYFASNAGPGVPLTRIVRAAFARWNVEHAFRVAKGEAGLSHYEGRSYVGLMRHLVLCLVVVGFVAVRAAELRGEKPGGDAGAGVPGAERPLRRAARPGSRRSASNAHG
jgi:SRSO17 transposase